MKHGGRITRYARGRIGERNFFYPAGASPILPALFARILFYSSTTDLSNSQSLLGLALGRFNC